MGGGDALDLIRINDVVDNFGRCQQDIFISILIKTKKELVK